LLPELRIDRARHDVMRIPNESECVFVLRVDANKEREGVHGEAAKTNVSGYASRPQARTERGKFVTIVNVGEALHRRNENA
jgi:hypothetical protein